jgi:hypothetical protein
MADKSADGVYDLRGRQEQHPEGSQNTDAPPHPPGQNHHSQREVHSHPHQDPHELQLQQGDLRHRQDARGEPRGASNILTAVAADATDTTPGQPRHPISRSDLLHAALEAATHSTSAPTDPPAPSSSTSTAASQAPAPALAAAASAINAPPSTDHGLTPTPQIVDRDHIRSLASGEPSPTSSGVATPTEHSRRRHIKLRPLVQAIMAFEKGRKFSTGTSVHRKRQMSTLVEKEGQFGPALTVRFHLLLFPLIPSLEASGPTLVPTRLLCDHLFCHRNSHPSLLAMC